MNKWESAIGKWNDFENYDIEGPQWRLALSYAKEQYDGAGVYWEYIDGNKNVRVPYIIFVQNVMKIIINELHISDDYLLTLCALARVEELTGCSLEENEALNISYVAEELREFPRKNNDNVIEYYARIFDGSYKDEIMLIILVELLFVLRQEKCTCTDWEEEEKNYFKIEKLIIQYLVKKPSQRLCFLCEKIKEQLHNNIDISRDENKKSEQLHG